MGFFFLVLLFVLAQTEEFGEEDDGSNLYQVREIVGLDPTSLTGVRFRDDLNVSKAGKRAEVSNIGMYIFAG